MNKLVAATLTTFLASAGSSFAQQTPLQSPSADATAESQAHERQDQATGNAGHSAFSRNVGPGSTIGGTPRNGITSDTSGNPENPHAPAAGSANGGGGK